MLSWRKKPHVFIFVFSLYKNISLHIQWLWSRTHNKAHRRKRQVDEETNSLQFSFIHTFPLLNEPEVLSWCRLSVNSDALWRGSSIISRNNLVQGAFPKMSFCHSDSINVPKPNPWFSILILIAKVFHNQFFSARALPSIYTFHNATPVFLVL